MRISFKLNREYDTELIRQLEKYKEKNLSQVIRKILRDSLVYRKCEVDVFAEEEVINTITTNEIPVSNTDNDKVEVRKINKKTEINNSNTNNKSKSIKWDNPNLK